ncbi:restriction system-associated AAA family ATPase [Flavobacterium sp. ABG]|uniref:restriction system-associated AAA family ATPase n=1 Tax=Flavobacterium sp. ABG TaxID=1423322 RepID=UPI00064A3213|nr:restriction system-associated AAA family ATPase [Flavobacterium sp. ABG]KLT69617.1 hypothetical protein AB674_11785 [Flavobacterium sp. ABG]
MKIRRLKIYDIESKPLLKGVDLFFEKETTNIINANCFIGANGSGKSQVLEVIIEIFLYIDNLFRNENKLDQKKIFSPFAFRIEYEIYVNTEIHLVIFECDTIRTSFKNLHIEILKKGTESIENLDITSLSISDYIPTKIAGYSSGSNETLSLPFDSYYDEYAEYTWKRAKKIKDSNDYSDIDYDPRLYYMNYNTNLGIVISSFIFKDKLPEFEFILNELRIKELKSFVITIQTLGPLAPNRTKGGVILTPELELWKQKLINISDENIVDEKHQLNTLKFNINEETILAFKDNFSSALELYTCLYKLELLNNLIVDKTTRDKIKKERKERRLVTKMPIVSDINKVLNYSELKFILKDDSEINYLSLSDGEHQFINVFGTLLMINQENCLFLLDEPETHFNPTWRKKFIRILEKITTNRKLDVFITTHSPFVVSDCKQEQVFIFKREDNNQILICKPDKETYGTAFDNILEMAFNINPPISENSLQEIQKLQHENNPKVIENRLSDFGDSLEKASLVNRMVILKNKEK